MRTRQTRASSWLRAWTGGTSRWIWRLRCRATLRGGAPAVGGPQCVSRRDARRVVPARRSGIWRRCGRGPVPVAIHRNARARSGRRFAYGRKAERAWECARARGRAGSRREDSGGYTPPRRRRAERCGSEAGSAAAARRTVRLPRRVTRTPRTAGTPASCSRRDGPPTREGVRARAGEGGLHSRLGADWPAASRRSRGRGPPGRRREDRPPVS